MIRISQAGQVISDCKLTFRGVAIETGKGNGVPCFLCVYAGNPLDPRKGVKITSRRYGGPVSVQVVDENGRVVHCYGVASAQQVASHPQGSAAKV